MLVERFGLLKTCVSSRRNGNLHPKTPIWHERARKKCHFWRSFLSLGGVPTFWASSVSSRGHFKMTVSCRRNGHFPEKCPFGVRGVEKMKRAPLPEPGVSKYRPLSAIKPTFLGASGAGLLQRVPRDCFSGVFECGFCDPSHVK